MKLDPYTSVSTEELGKDVLVNLSQSYKGKVQRVTTTLSLLKQLVAAIEKEQFSLSAKCDRNETEGEGNVRNDSLEKLQSI